MHLIVLAHTPEWRIGIVILCGGSLYNFHFVWGVVCKLWCPRGVVCKITDFYMYMTRILSLSNNPPQSHAAPSCHSKATLPPTSQSPPLLSRLRRHEFIMSLVGMQHIQGYRPVHVTRWISPRACAVVLQVSDL